MKQHIGDILSGEAATNATSITTQGRSATSPTSRLLQDNAFALILSEYSMNMRTRNRRQQADERRTQLMATALDVFAAQGLDGATVKDLSDAAGAGHRLLYDYLRSNDERLHAVLDV